MIDYRSSILENRPVAPGFFRLRFLLPEGIAPEPGQFFSVKGGRPTETLLRRPFAFSGVCGREAETLYQVRGRTTRALSSWEPGTELQVLLPCGNGFPLSEAENAVPVLIAGGVGLGPVLFLDRVLRSRSVQPLLIAGFRTAEAVPEEGTLPADALICTDDGSRGFHGHAAAALKTAVSGEERTAVFSCGPTAMMKAVSQIAEKRNWRSFVSLEAMMGCSLGACMGCAVPTAAGGYRRVCKEGPVFDSREILWTSM